jgi:hypothetical protein
MLRITALSDFIAAINQKHLIALTAIVIVLATAMEIARRGPTRRLMVILNTCVSAMMLLGLAFFLFAARNSVIVPQYGSSDLFLSVLLVLYTYMFCAFAHKGVAQPGSFHFSFLIMGGIVSLVVSGLLAVLFPLAHKVYEWIF